MSDLAEKTESLRDYAEMLGSPDSTTTARMRARLETYMLERRKQRRRWLAIAGLVLVAGGAATFAVLATDDTPEHAVRADDQARVIEIAGTRLVLEPGTSVATAPDDDARVELLEGELQLTAGEQTFVVESGEFTVSIADARVRVRHTAAMPVVTVERGEAGLFGPGLPRSGIRVLP